MKPAGCRRQELRRLPACRSLREERRADGGTTLTPSESFLETTGRAIHVEHDERGTAMGHGPHRRSASTSSLAKTRMYGNDPWQLMPGS